MEAHDLKKLAAILSESDQYRVTEKYKKPEFYNTDDSSDKLIGVFLDIEATGLSCNKDKLIELGMVKFEYTQDGRIFSLLDEFSSYQDPNMPIPEVISKLTGITDDMVKGHQINENEVASYLEDVDIIIAHNAGFDRVFLEMTFPNIALKAWGCSMYDIDWKIEGISSHKLEYIAYKYNFFFKGHRAIVDCLAGIHILAQELLNSRQAVLKQLLVNALAVRFKLYANNSPYESKDLLKARGYKWSMNQNDKHRAWYIELTEDKVAEEINYLRSNIYGGSSINIPVEIFDAYSRFSGNDKQLLDPLKHQEKLEWFQSLCLG
ncbi:DNA polymerase III PolC-type (plasmid) [Candidatus Trichorickettsia mobilis]|uniref:3'-5' exonuclease n=1 Tax=Candidatus Trichorickettsia mobilis TaxID=1346319 RepID=UPI002B256619|nr:3'-5' exonuclease [Candidatus Trichorickettsia mobilis]WPY01906.1 DNA polymerase III PolC-type [Candidatus Trichorickettsia mobilis]